MIAGVRRNYTVVGLCRHSDRPDRSACYTVLAVTDGKEQADPTDTGLTVGEFIDPNQLHRGGIFGYFRPEEVQVFRRGLTESGRDKSPETGKARRKG